MLNAIFGVSIEIILYSVYVVCVSCVVCVRTCVCRVRACVSCVSCVCVCVCRVCNEREQVSFTGHGRHQSDLAGRSAGTGACRLHRLAAGRPAAPARLVHGTYAPSPSALAAPHARLLTPSRRLRASQIFGGIKYKEQRFSPTVAGVSSVLLIISIIGTLHSHFIINIIIIIIICFT
jgi:hypothetical protein